MKRAFLFSALCCLLFHIAGCGDSASPIARVEWPVMGTIAAIQGRGDDGVASEAFARVGAAFDDVVKEFNAFDPASHLNKIAPLSDAEIINVTGDECYSAAFKLMELSGRAFNPRWKGPSTLDMGAIAKGYAVDLAASKLESDDELLIDLGGNLKAVKGDWKTGVRDPASDGCAATLTLHEGEALATSATYYRGNHICDGRTGAIVSNEVASVTVLANSAMWADGLSTTLFILGPKEGRMFLQRHLRSLYGAGGTFAVLWILKDGTKLTYGDARF